MIQSVRDRATFAALARARRYRRGPVWLRCALVAPTGARGDAGSGAPRVAYAVTRGAGHAVERNRIRRRLRAAVAGHEDALVAGAAYLFGADRDVLHTPFARLDRAVGELLRAASEMT